MIGEWTKEPSGPGWYWMCANDRVMAVEVEVGLARLGRPVTIWMPGQSTASNLRHYPNALWMKIEEPKPPTVENRDAD